MLVLKYKNEAHYKHIYIMKNNTFNSKLKVIALSLLIMAMTFLMYNDDSNFKYWIGVIIILISLLVINFDFFKISKNNKNTENQD